MGTKVQALGLSSVAFLGILAGVELEVEQPRFEPTPIDAGIADSDLVYYATTLVPPFHFYNHQER